MEVYISMIRDSMALQWLLVIFCGQPIINLDFPVIANLQFLDYNSVGFPLKTSV